MLSIKDMCDMLYGNGTNASSVNYVQSKDVRSNFFTSSEDQLTYLYKWQRILLGIIFAILLLMGAAGNVWTLITTSKRKYQMLYKSSLISLAISDLVMTTFVGIDSLDKVTNDYLTWRLGTFMCSFLPYITTVSALVSSMTLVCIAFDRYQGIVLIRGTWDPSLLPSGLIMSTFWIVSAGISVPVFLWYETFPITVVDCTAMTSSDEYLCWSYNSSKYFYFTIVFALIFLPLLAAFIGVYIVIGNFIWMKGKPQENYEQDSSTVVTNMTENVTIGPDRTRIEENQQIPKTKKASPKNTNYVQKKKRTLKIVLLILGTFVVCRLPQWIFIVVTSHPNISIVDNILIFIKHLCSALSVSNAAINPFIYAFLNEVITWQQNFKKNARNWRKFKFWNSIAKSYSLKH